MQIANSIMEEDDVDVKKFDHPAFGNIRYEYCVFTRDGVRLMTDAEIAQIDADRIRDAKNRVKWMREFRQQMEESLAADPILPATAT